MKILFAPNFYYPMLSGVPVIAHQLAKNLLGKGHEVVVVTPQLDPSHPPFEQMDGIDVHRLPFFFPMRVFWQYPQDNLPAFLRNAPADMARLLRLLADGQFDLIHIHSLNGPHFLYLALAHLLVARPLVVTLHGSEFFLFNSRRMDWRRLFKWMIFRRAAMITGVSSKTVSEVGRIYPKASGKLAKTPNFVNVDEFSGPKQRSLSFPYILSVGRLNHLKGHDVLLAAFKRLAEKDREIRLVVTGDGPLKIRLHALALALGLKERVIFPGEVDRERIKGLLAGCEFLAFASWVEGLPLAALEGMASAKPVVGTRVGGLPELISHTHTGLLVPPGDPQALAEAMSSLLRRPDHLQEMGERARQYVKTHYDPAQATERYLEVYRAILKPRGRRG